MPLYDARMSGAKSKLLCFLRVCVQRVLERRMLQTQGLLCKTAKGKSFFKAGIILSGYPDSNWDYILPKDACYRYTIRQ